MTNPPKTDLKHNSKYMAIPSPNGFETQLKTGEFEVFLFKLCHWCVHKTTCVGSTSQNTTIRTNGTSFQTECEKLIFN
jgi:hypothetical protein